MKSKIKYFVIIICLIMFCFPFVIKANNGSAIGGYGGSTGALCDDCTWTYNDTGLRFSLYKYDGTTLTYYTSVDYCNSYPSGNGKCNTNNAYQSHGFGKLAYQQLGHNVNDAWTNRTVNIKNDNSYFLSHNYLNGYTNGLSSKVEEYFQFSSNNKQTIYKKIKEMFPLLILTENDLYNLYLTVEPTMNIGDGSNRYYGTAFELNSRFINGDDLGNIKGINGQVYKYMPDGIIASKIFGDKDKHNLVGTSDSSLVKLVPTTGLYDTIWATDSTEYRKANAKLVTSKAGYGIAVYWLGNYAPATPSCTISESTDKKTYTLNISNGNNEIHYDISNSTDSLKHNVKNTTYSASFKDQNIVGAIYNSSGNKIANCEMERSIPTCTDTCSGKSGDSLLGCAEDYCQVMSGNKGEKKNCITTCGYNDPGFSACAGNSSTNGRDTVCDKSTNANKTTCTKATTSTYYKRVCTDATTISYGSSLPTTLIPGAGFTYTPVVSGSKTCEMTFEADKWKFDYASAYTDNERNILMGILNRYNDVSDASIWSQDINNIYKYDSSNAEIKIEVTDSNDLTKPNRKTNKTLVVNKTENLLSKEIVVSSAGTKSIPKYANGGSSNVTVLRLIKTNSSNKTDYKLPGVCMNAGDGTLYELSSAGICDTNNDGPYDKYFVDFKTEEDDYDTRTTVKKDSSTLDVINTCNYKVIDGDSLSCSIKITDCTSGVKEEAELRIQNKGGLSISYGLSSSDYTINNRKTISINSSMKKLYGAISVDGKIVETCSLDLSVATCPGSTPSPSDNNCPSKFKPSEYNEISKYCRTSWMTDVNGYASEKDCFNSCSYGSNTCKNNPDVNVNDYSSVKRFCEDSNNRLENGYNKADYGNVLVNEQHNIAMCVNDCYVPQVVPDGNCLGVICDYLYRPISLKDPFPNNREPGANWIGKEIFITDDLYNPLLNESAEAEYIIELTPELIDKINKNTDRYNSGKNKNAYIDYVYKDYVKTNGKYISKFIHNDDIENGGFKSIFKKGS